MYKNHEQRDQSSFHIKIRGTSKEGSMSTYLLCHIEEGNNLRRNFIPPSHSRSIRDGQSYIVTRFSIVILIGLFAGMTCLSAERKVVRERYMNPGIAINIITKYII